MSNRFSNRRGSHRFRPSGGLNPNAKPDKAALQARLAATDGPEKLSSEEGVFAKNREHEIRRAENLAAGLPAEGEAAPVSKPAGRHDYREPNLETPEQVDAEPEGGFQPVEVRDQSKGILGSIKQAAQKVVAKVKKLIKPEKKVHKEVIINTESLETRVGVLEDGRLEEFTIERTSDERLVGSIYKGKIRNLEDGLKAAFVDIGFEKNAFLHYWDIVPSNLDSGVELVEREKKSPPRDKPKVTQKDIPRLYPKGTDIIIQVTKGPIGTKGPRVTTHLALPGRYLVLLPNSDQSGVSRKIDDPEERQRLKKIVRKLNIPDGMGVIIRTAGEAQQERYFIRDLAFLLEEWKAVQERIEKQNSATCVFQEPDLIERTVRDFLTEDVERIVIDDSKQFERMQTMIGKISKRSIDKVKLYNEPQPVFDRFGISRQLEASFSRQVHLKSGGYLVVDETEALVAIDVNTGSHKSKEPDRDKEHTITRVNLEAAEEICRLLRLRNLGGLIVLDFIDMRHRRDQQTVYQRVKEGLKRDRAKTHILPISQLGLMEMTRQRHTESIRSTVYQDCPYCKGRAKVKSALTMSVEIQRKLQQILKGRPRTDEDFQLRIISHPAVLDRLRKEDEKILIEMEKRFFGKLTFRADPAFHVEHFKIINAVSNEELASVGG
ncbi:MAG: Rne/Rng family ribonuclease [Verrucomicrobia bacterium]|nr:Rne/Rng family ribonuclease [Verrucomicrobiota bacterium]